jgi:hypothetical protein
MLCRRREYGLTVTNLIRVTPLGHNTLLALPSAMSKEVGGDNQVVNDFLSDMNVLINDATCVKNLFLP